MHGEIWLKGWNAFEAQEVIHWGRGFMWRATVRMRWAFVRGGDSFRRRHRRHALEAVRRYPDHERVGT